MTAQDPGAMHRGTTRRWMAPVVAVLVSLMVLAGGSYASRYIEKQLVRQEREDVGLRLQPYARGLTIALTRRAERIKGLSDLVDSVSSVAQLDAKFPNYARGLMVGASGVLALQLLDHGVVRWVYPLERNEAVVNRSVVRQNEHTSVTTESSDGGVPRLEMSPPHNLMQGPFGFIIRQRFLPKFPGAPDRAAVVVELDSLLDVANLLEPIAKLDVVLLDRAGKVVHPKEHAVPAQADTVNVPTPDGDWKLLGAPAEGWSGALAGPLSVLKWTWRFMAILIGAVAYFVVDRQTRLRAAVLARTRDLSLANAELRREVEEREKAEHSLRENEERLLHSQKMEAMGTLAGGIAHDFNNLLTAIIGFGRMAEERATAHAVARPDPALDEIRADVGEVLRAAEHASIVTNQLLAFSRKQVVNPAALDAGDVVASIEVLLRRLLGERIRFTMRIEDRPARVYADRGQLVQVLMNLAVNARDAMPDGGDLTLEVRRCTFADVATGTTAVPPGAYIEIAATDNGVGMTPQVLSRAFEPFFTTKGIGKGTGLGLSTVYGIVQRAGGYVLATSEVGRGSRFRILLPEIAKPDNDGAGTPPAASRGANTATILVAEDEPAVRNIVTRVLRRNGYTVLEASSGEEALSLSAATPGPIELLLTDLVMAGIGGRVLAEELRARRPEVRVIYMSGYTDEARSIGELDGVRAAFLAKPFTPDVLLDLVRKLVDASAAGA